MHLTWARAAGMGAFLWAASAAAQPSPEESPTWLVVRADEDPCIRPAELIADVERALGSNEPPAGVRIEVEAVGERWRFELHHGSGPIAEREFSALPRGCEARREAVSLALALAIEHALAAERSEQAAPPVPAPEPAPSEPAPPPASRPPEAPPEAAQPASAARAVHVHVGLAGGGNVGLLPRPSCEGRLLGELSWGSHAALVFGGVVSSRTHMRLAEGRLLARAVGASLDTCFGGVTGRMRLYGCLGSAVSAVLGTGSGLAQDGHDATASGTIELSASGRVLLRERLSLLWRLGAFTQWLRPRYQALTTETEGQSEVADQLTFPPVGGRLLLGMTWQVR